jgi:hypothetical protein
LPEIGLFILLPLQLQELVHGESGRASVILVANLFYNVILFSFWVVFNGPLHKACILEIKGITVREIIWITPTVLQRIPGCVLRALLRIEILSLEKGQGGYKDGNHHLRELIGRMGSQVFSLQLVSQ